ncbi:MAG: hypothetical protein CM15mP22_7740 [Gammaproteobacteria bacterium]|nr:MAG: hypothetical protein CM15mP22_7740 [Gammaproteobacteria bacterium]
MDENGDPYKFSIFDYKGNYALKLGVTGARNIFSNRWQNCKHRIGEINQKIWNDEFKVFLS